MCIRHRLFVSTLPRTNVGESVWTVPKWNLNESTEASSRIIGKRKECYRHLFYNTKPPGLGTAQ